MSDKDNLSFHQGDEEEFHITDEDIDRELAAMDADQPVIMSEEAAATSAVEEKSSLKKRFAVLKQLKRKHWIIIAVVLVIVLFGLIKLMGSSQSTPTLEPIAPITTPAKSSATLPKLETKPTVQIPAPANPLPDLSAIPVQQTTTSKNAASTGADALTEIQKQNQMLLQQMASLSQRVVSLESALTQSNQAVEGLSQQVVTLKQPIGSTSMPVAVMPSMSNAAPSTALPPEPQYTVEAVVPQRAWLQTSDGNTVTVTIGDEVPGLGAVTAIDPYSGNVNTASGTTIKYAN